MIGSTALSNGFQKLPVTYKKTTILTKNGTASHFYPQIANFQVKISITFLEIV